MNVGGTQNVASLGAPLVYYSTDYVFDGRKREPYVESDGPEPGGRHTGARSCTAKPRPASARGSSGRRGSTARRGTTSSARCFGSAQSGTKALSSTTSAAAPTYVGHLAEAYAGARRAAVRRVPRGRAGRVHVGGVRGGDLRGGGARHVACGGSRARSSGAPARRPAYSVLRSEKPETPVLPNWREGLRACLDKLTSAFLTTWLVDAEIERVWDVVYAIDRWPEWWRGVQSVTELAHGDGDGEGNGYRHVWRSRDPRTPSGSTSTVEEVRAPAPDPCSRGRRARGDRHVSPLRVTARHRGHVRLADRTHHEGLG